jgi:membrane protease YdiL (CAAX protease family)
VEQERWSEALAAAERAQASTPDDPRIGLLRIQALVGLGRRPEAERVLDEELWQQLGEARWRPVLRSYPPQVLTSWARRVALRRFARRAPPGDTADAARAALAGMLAPASTEVLLDQLAVALVAVRVGPLAKDEVLTRGGHELLTARCPPTWAAGALLLPWVLLVILLPWGPRARGLAMAAGAGLLAAELQVVAAGLAGSGLAGTWTLLLEPLVSPVTQQAAVLAAGLGVAALGLVLLAWSGARAEWLGKLTAAPTRAELVEGLRWGAGVVAWLGLLVLARAAWRAAGGQVGLLEAVHDLLAPRAQALPPGAGWAAAAVTLRLVLGPWLEEAFFRGALFGRLRERFDWQGAAVLSALAFALAHGRDPVALVGVGILLAAARHRTTHLWPCVVAHAIWNAVALGLVWL